MSEIKSKNNTRNTQTPQKVEFKRPSLSQAMEIEVTLKSCKKFELNDRAVFARNIGSLVAKEIKKNTSLTVHKIFQRAFGNTAESLYKKRKSLITLPQEASPQDSERQDLRSKARDYLEIITTLSIIKSEYSEESQTALRKKLILRLVESSSFDDQQKIKDRIYEESLSHLREQMAKIVDRITNEVDLDYQFAWYENYLPGAATSCENLICNNTAPSIRIVDIMRRYEAEEHAEITLTRDEINSTDGTSNGIKKLIREKLLKDYNEVSYNEEDLDIAMSSPHLTGDDETVDEMFPKLEFNHTYGIEYFKKSSVYLEVRFDEWSDRWQLIASWKVIDQDYQVGLPSDYDRNDNDDYRQPYYKKNFSVQTEKALEIYSYYSGHTLTDYTLFAVEHGDYGLSESEDVTYSLFVDEHENDFYTAYDHKIRGLDFIAPSAAHYDHYDHAVEGKTFNISDMFDFLMSKPQHDEELKRYRIFDQIQRHETTHDVDVFTKAPAGSFAEIILQNLAYAAEEDRIDNLLLKDAKQRNKVFKEHEKQCEKNYFDGLKKFE